MTSPRRLRLAILGDSPCPQCYAACCLQNGHAYAILLQGPDELRRFAPWAVSVSIQPESGIVGERVVPYRDGRCPFLGDDALCTIYDDRPAACRAFQCVRYFNANGIGRHGRFLDLNPRVRELLE